MPIHRLIEGSPIARNHSQKFILQRGPDKMIRTRNLIGFDDDSLFDIIGGIAKLEGHLPFKLPSFAEALKSQKSGALHDFTNPLYQYGYGLSY